MMIKHGLNLYPVENVLSKRHQRFFQKNNFRNDTFIYLRICFIILKCYRKCFAKSKTTPNHETSPSVFIFGVQGRCTSFVHIQRKIEIEILQLLTDGNILNHNNTSKFNWLSVNYNKLFLHNISCCDFNLFQLASILATLVPLLVKSMHYFWLLQYHVI